MTANKDLPEEYPYKRSVLSELTNDLNPVFLYSILCAFITISQPKYSVGLMNGYRLMKSKVIKLIAPRKRVFFCCF